MCLRLGCPFKDVRKEVEEEFIRVVIFGVTGMTGTAVLSAVLACIWFKVTVFTRRPKDPMWQGFHEKSIDRIVDGDLFYYESVLDAIKGNDAVFFSTTYFDTMRVDCEFEQGSNVVKAAMEAGVKHVVYVGTTYNSLLVDREIGKCRYLQGKEKVEAHLVNSGLPYTILHLGFYYENLLSVFRPHKISKNVFAVAIPMGNVPLNCGSVIDFGHCVARILLRPALYIFNTIKLATGYHTVEDFATALDNHFQNLTFTDPKIPLSVYESFDFRGARELATMFAHYHTITEPWSQDAALSMLTQNCSLSEWIASHEQDLVEAMEENLEDIAVLNAINVRSLKPVLKVTKPKHFSVRGMLGYFGFRRLNTNSPAQPVTPTESQRKSMIGALAADIMKFIPEPPDNTANSATNAELEILSSIKSSSKPSSPTPSELIRSTQL